MVDRSHDNELSRTNVSLNYHVSAIAEAGIYGNAFQFTVFQNKYPTLLRAGNRFQGVPRRRLLAN